MNNRYEFESMPAKDLDKYIYDDNALIIDLREEKEYKEKHIKNAVNYPYSKFEAMQVSRDYLYNVLPKNYKLILYCDRGGVSFIAAKQLARNGYNVYSVVGGINAYRGENYE